MEKMALSVIDAQVNMFEPEPVYQGDRILETLMELIDLAREEHVPIIYIRNNGGPGDPDQPGTPGWEIHPRLKPLARDVIIDKSSPDAFEGTILKEALNRQGIRELMLAGMQTEFCIDATTRRAVELGYGVTVVADGHSTYNSEELSAKEAIEKYNDELSRIAQVRQAREIDF